MQNDEQQIRILVQEWADATKAGELSRVLPLMTEDVVFLRPGCEPMIGRDAFAAASAAMSSARPRFEVRSEVQEVRVSGDLAYCWTKLSVAVTPEGGETVRREGHTLSVFRRDESGRWALARDANMLVAVK